MFKARLSRFKRFVRLLNPFSGSSLSSSSEYPEPAPKYRQATCASSRVNAPLENLPPEVRCRLLSVLALDELCTLVHASPVFHAQYLRHRRSLLGGGLQTTLRSAAVDAYAVYQSGIANISKTRSSEAVVRFLDIYSNRRSSSKFLILDEKFTEEDIVGMVAFHHSVIKPLARLYAAWTLSNLACDTQDGQQHELLSRTEETRILRALYRFQLSCNLFGRGTNESNEINRVSHGSKSGLWAAEILKNFLCIFEPWEVEEIACIYTFSREKYNQIFDDIRWDVHPKNPKFEEWRPPTPEGAFHLDHSWTRQSLLRGTISRGLVLLCHVLTTTGEELVPIMQKHISWPAGDFLEDALSETAQHQRRQECVSEQDEKQQQHDPLPFCGDSEDEGCPPLTWTLIWRGTYSNLYGDYVQDDMRQWGYVMWDAARLEHTNAKQILMRQWEASWGDDDPREMFG